MSEIKNLLDELQKYAPYFNLNEKDKDFRLITVEEFLDSVIRYPLLEEESLKLNPSTIFRLFGLTATRQHNVRAANWLRNNGFHYHKRDGNFRVALKAINNQSGSLRLI